MSKIFTRTFRVRWSELDASGTVAPAAYLRYLVETAYDWGANLGLGPKNDRLLGLFWLIRETEIRFLRPLRHNDLFDFTIWMVNWQRVRGTRCFELTLKDSAEIIAQGSQHIVAMDAQTGRPTSLPEDLINNFRLDQPRSFPFERFPKIAAPENPLVMQRQVEWGDLDALEHVNNAIYVTYAEEAAAQDLATRGQTPAKLAESNLRLATRRLQIQYLSPAVWGETLTISTHPLTASETDGLRYVGMARTDGSPVCECLLDWQLVAR
ncbi:MAG: thioesterase [Anaerolineales bacterium]|jgi:acyl-CoA thioester hydrolase|nr:thioesterase [Anaerolineales bacterium]